MIQSYTKYKQFKSLVDVKENEKAVRSGLDFLRFVAEEYSWASDKKNPVQQSITDALMYIGFMKLV